MDLNEKKAWKSWEGQQPDKPEGLLKRLWEVSGSYKQGYQPDMEKGLAALQGRMGQQGPAKVVRLAPAKILLRIAAGAMLVAIGVAVFKGQLFGSEKLQAVVSPAEGTKELALNDGSTVTLNRASELAYSPDFAKQERRVKLQGEAFFQVARDEKRPFIIETALGEVTVLGTSFNVRTYPDEGIFEVFVASGKVKVEISQNGQVTELKQGEYFIFDKKANKASTKLDKSGLPLAWQTGIISFRGQPIPMVLEGMERLFGVKIDLKTIQKADCLQTLTVQKDKFGEAIEALKASCPKLKFDETTKGGYSVSGVCCE